jgi:membrane-associated phospholipid phosphatase
MQLAAKVVSYLFHPLLLVTYTFAYVILLNPDIYGDGFSFHAKKMYLLIWINTFVFPSLVTFLLWRLGFISSIFLREKKERTVPYIAAGLFFTWSYIVFSKQEMAAQVAMNAYGTLLLNSVMLGATIAVFAAFLINIFMKISMHTVGMGALGGVALVAAIGSTYNLLLPLSGVILVAGLVGSSRMKLGAHTPFEIYGGYLVGIFCQLIAFKLA